SSSSGMPTTVPDESTSSGPSTEEPTTSVGQTTTTTTGETPTDASGGSTTLPPGSGGMCNIYDQDCPEGQKCTAHASPNTFIPDGIKCVPIPDNPQAHNEPCAVG